MERAKQEIEGGRSVAPIHSRRLLAREQARSLLLRGCFKMAANRHRLILEDGQGQFTTNEWAIMHLNYGLCLMNMDQDGQAISYLLKAIDIDPSYPKPYYRLLTLWKETHNYETALSLNIPESINRLDEIKQLREQIRSDWVKSMDIVDTIHRLFLAEQSFALSQVELCSIPKQSQDLPGQTVTSVKSNLTPICDKLKRLFLFSLGDKLQVVVQMTPVNQFTQNIMAIGNSLSLLYLQLQKDQCKSELQLLLRTVRQYVLWVLSSEKPNQSSKKQEGSSTTIMESFSAYTTYPFLSLMMQFYAQFSHSMFGGVQKDQMAQQQIIQSEVQILPCIVYSQESHILSILRRLVQHDLKSHTANNSIIKIESQTFQTTNSQLSIFLQLNRPKSSSKLNECMKVIVKQLLVKDTIQGISETFLRIVATMGQQVQNRTAPPQQNLKSVSSIHELVWRLWIAGWSQQIDSDIWSQPTSRPQPIHIGSNQIFPIDEIEAGRLYNSQFFLLILFPLLLKRETQESKNDKLLLFTRKFLREIKNCNLEQKMTQLKVQDSSNHYQIDGLLKMTVQQIIYFKERVNLSTNTLRIHQTYIKSYISHQLNNKHQRTNCFSVKLIIENLVTSIKITKVINTEDKEDSKLIHQNIFLLWEWLLVQKQISSVNTPIIIRFIQLVAYCSVDYEKIENERVSRRLGIEEAQVIKMRGLLEGTLSQENNPNAFNTPKNYVHRAFFVGELCLSQTYLKQLDQLCHTVLEIRKSQRTLREGSHNSSFKWSEFIPLAYIMDQCARDGYAKYLAAPAIVKLMAEIIE